MLLPHVFSPGLPRGRRGAGGGAGLPGQPLQVHEGATHAHPEGAPSRLQAECVPGVQAGRGGARQGTPTQAGHRGAPPFWVTLDAASPRGLYTERVPPSRHRAGSGWGWISTLTGHWAPSARGVACLAIPVALSGYVLVLCLPDRARGTGCWLPLPPAKTESGPALSFLQLTCGRSTRPWRSWGPMSW